MAPDLRCAYFGASNTLGVYLYDWGTVLVYGTPDYCSGSNLEVAPVKKKGPKKAGLPTGPHVTLVLSVAQHEVRRPPQREFARRRA